MTELLQIAFEKLNALPESEQNKFAAYLMDLVADSELSDEIAPEHLEGVLEGLAQAERGEFVPEEEMQAFFARHLK